MKSIVIKANEENDIKLLLYLAEKMGMDAKVLDEEALEDAGLLKAMVEGRNYDFVSEEEVIKALNER